MTFDCYGTLVDDRTAVETARRLLCGILDERAIPVEQPLVEHALIRVREAFMAGWRAQRAFSAADAAELCLTRLDLFGDEKLRQALTDLFGEVSPDNRLTPGASEVLRRLRDAGFRLGVICDVGLAPSDRLMAHLERLGVLDLFDHLSFSDRVGVYKPDPAIFADVLQGLGVEDPATVAHVGDRRLNDVMGARDSGFTTIRYTGVFDDLSDLPDADHVVHHHAEIPGIVSTGCEAAR